MIKVLRGLTFFKKSFQGWWVIASYHHPDSITWRWSISLNQKWLKLCLPKFGPSYSMGTKYLAPNGDFGAWFTIPLIGTFGISTQQHLWKERKGE